jgi:hypothetical protein
MSALAIDDPNIRALVTHAVVNFFMILFPQKIKKNAFEAIS